MPLTPDMNQSFPTVPILSPHPQAFHLILAPFSAREFGAKLARLARHLTTGETFTDNISAELERVISSYRELLKVHIGVYCFILL